MTRSARLIVCAMLMMLALSPSAMAAPSDVAASLWGWIELPLVILLLTAGSWAMREAAVFLRERTHASRVARLVDVLASQAEGIADTLISKAPTAGATLPALRSAAVAQTIAYARTNLGATIKAIGVPDDTLATRLNNEVLSVLRNTPSSPARDEVLKQLGEQAPAAG